MKRIISILISALVIGNAMAQSQATIYADGQETTVLVPNAENYTIEFPIESGVAAKTFSSPMARELSYVLFVGGGDEAVGLDNVHNTNSSYAGAKSWKKFAKSGGVIKETLEGRDINDALRRLKTNNWPDKDFKMKVWIETYANLKGDMTVLSEAWITIPASLKTEYFAGENEKVYKMFTSGAAAHTIDDYKLQTAIKKYMETKWPGENITTVNLRYFAYKDLSKTNFKFEGYYITQKNGVCKWNSCYGDGSDHGDRYSISFFNSMNAESKMQCENAVKLSNM